MVSDSNLKAARGKIMKNSPKLTLTLFKMLFMGQKCPKINTQFVGIFFLQKRSGKFLLWGSLTGMIDSTSFLLYA